MTLFEKIVDCVHLGWDVQFSKEIMNVSVTVKKEINGKAFELSSWLPLDDKHFEEQAIIEAIDFNIERIQKLNSKSV